MFKLKAMSIIIIVLILVFNVLAKEEFKIVSLDEGDVKGIKFWNGDFYEFFGVPYASVPTGRNRFKGPLPPKPWEGVYEANNSKIICTQIFFGHDEEDNFVYGQDDCLSLNLFVPLIANEKNLLPVVVYIHSGGFAIGNGNMARYNYLARHDIIVISINYRLGALGFLCLGTEEVPGNAGLKDQVAALRWIKKYIRRFGGDPTKVTVAGFSVGAGLAELLTLSKLTEGLIDKIILDSGSALSSWAINRDPVSTAIHIADQLGYNGTADIEELTKFYLTTPSKILSLKSLNFFLENGTFGFAPCIENRHKNIEPFLTESPLDIFNEGKNNKVSVLTGFANMEGLSRIDKLESWKNNMNEIFFKFIPTDLKFSDESEKNNVALEIKKRYFRNKAVSSETLNEYIDYFSDSMFIYSILHSAEQHAIHSERPVYLYEFSYFGDLSSKHNYMNIIRGASHRDQTAYILDFYSWTQKLDDMDVRDRLTLMWADFIKYGNPTTVESFLVNYKWPKFTTLEAKYLSINKTIEIRRKPLEDRYMFWFDLYKKYYSHPTAPMFMRTNYIEMSM